MVSIGKQLLMYSNEVMLLNWKKNLPLQFAKVPVKKKNTFSCAMCTNVTWVFVLVQLIHIFPTQCNID